MGPLGFNHAARWLAIDLSRHNRYRCRQTHLASFGMGQLVLPSPPKAVACACKDTVTVTECCASRRSMNSASLRSALLRRKPSSNLEQQLLQDRLFEIIEAD